MKSFYKKKKLSLIVVYFPHSGYKDEEVQKVYDEVSKQLYYARARKRISIIGGDWNAECDELGAPGLHLMCSAVGVC